MLRQHEGLYESIIYQEDPLIPYNKSLQKHKELRENQEYINKGIINNKLFRIISTIISKYTC